MPYLDSNIRHRYVSHYLFNLSDSHNNENAFLHILLYIQYILDRFLRLANAILCTCLCSTSRTVRTNFRNYRSDTRWLEMDD